MKTSKSPIKNLTYLFLLPRTATNTNNSINVCNTQALDCVINAAAIINNKLQYIIFLLFFFEKSIKVIMQADVNQHENIPLYDAFMGQFIP